jgi:hypothetical protein
MFPQIRVDLLTDSENGGEMGNKIEEIKVTLTPCGVEWRSGQSDQI